jgi:hypothetical protein
MTLQRRVALENAARRAAAAVHERAETLQNMRDKGVDYAQVMTVVPELTVSLLYPQILDAGAGVDPVILTEGPSHTEQGINEGNFRLTQTLRWYDSQYAIQVGDVLSMMLLPDDSWLAFDIRSDRDINAGIRHNRPPLTYGEDVRPLEDSDDWELQITGSAYANGTDSGSDTHHLSVDYSALHVTFKTNHVVKRMEVHDKDGLLIGFVPVFLTLPGEA